MKQILAHLKGIAAALWPLYEVWTAANSDGAITQDEYTSIGKAVAFFVTVWLVPNLGYVRAFAGQVFVGQDRLDQTVAEHVDPTPATGSSLLDTDRDGVPDADELRANEQTPVFDRTRVEHEWPEDKV